MVVLWGRVLNLRLLLLHRTVCSFLKQTMFRKQILRGRECFVVWQQQQIFFWIYYFNHIIACVFAGCSAATKSAALTTPLSRVWARCVCCRCTTTGSPASPREPSPPCTPCPPCECYPSTFVLVFIPLFYQSLNGSQSSNRACPLLSLPLSLSLFLHHTCSPSLSTRLVFIPRYWLSKQYISAPVHTHTSMCNLCREEQIPWSSVLMSINLPHVFVGHERDTRVCVSSLFWPPICAGYK